MLGFLAASSGTGLVATLVFCMPGPPAEGSRLLSTGEAGRLAQMRLTNHRDGHAGLTAVANTTEGPIRVTGWVDWRQQIIYASVQGPATLADRGLLQATPSVLAVHTAPPPASDASATSPPSRDVPTAPAPSHNAAAIALPSRDVAAASPPARPPADGWLVRPLAESRLAPVPALLTLVFAIAAERPDDASVLRDGGARWLGRDRVGNATVDVVLGPAPTTASSARYWLDDAGRLHRLEAMLPGQVPARVDFDRSTAPELVPIAALGGARIDPRPVNRAEARLLASMRPAGRTRSGTVANGALVELNLPTREADLHLSGREPDDPGRSTQASTRAVHLRGTGWISWAGAAAYLAVHGQDRPATRFLVRADHDGVATLATSRRSALGRSATADVGLPPLPPPGDRVWSYRARAGDGAQAHDLDLLIEAALDAGARMDRDLGRRAFRLRQDRIHARQVTVFEIHKPAEATTPPGQGRLRYWVDQSGALHRVELRTRTGAFAQLDIVPARVPRLPRVPLT